MSIPTPPAHGATGWDTWLVGALQSLDSVNTSSAASISTVSDNVVSLQAAVNTLISAVNDLKNQVANVTTSTTAVWG